jgi:hypothetical protein
MAWQAVHVMPACDVGSRSVSKSAREKAPEKSGTGSWQPAHQRLASTVPSRASIILRVSFTLAA